MTDPYTPVIVPLPNGLQLVLSSHQQLPCANFVMKEIFVNRTYSRPGFELRPTDTVVDIGANVGLFSLWAAPQVARVISMEPTNAIDCLNNSLALNQIKNVSTVRCAISDRSGTLDLLQYPGFNGHTHSATIQRNRLAGYFVNLFWPKVQEVPIRVTCPCQALEQMLQDQNVAQVDFLKVDCEGGEYSVFDSISDQTLAKVSRIAMEYHEFHPSHDHRRIVNRLQSAGYEVTIQRSLIERLVNTGMLWAKRRT